MKPNKLKLRRRSKSEIGKRSSALKLGTGVVDQKVLDLIDFANLMSWFDLALFARLSRNTARVTDALWKREADLPELPDDASDDERRRVRDMASELTTLIMRAEAAKNLGFGTFIMDPANKRFPPAHPLSSYVNGIQLVPSIRHVRTTLWRLAIAAKHGRASVDLPVVSPPRRTTFILHPDGTVGIHEDPAVIVLNDVIKNAISAITDVRRLRICNLRQRRLGNHLCGRIFWAERRDKWQCCAEHCDLARKHEKRPTYEATRHRKKHPDKPYRHTDQELAALSRDLQNIETEFRKIHDAEVKV